MLISRFAPSIAVPRPAAAQPETSLLRARELSVTTVLLVARGEIDAATAPEVFTAITARLAGYRQLVLDLSRVEFFGTAGYSLLHRVHALCARTAMDWVLVAGPEVQRLLRRCDPDPVFPTAPNIVSAVAALTYGPHRLDAPGRFGLTVH